MKTIGLLPASGKATRVGGIPKFILPISDETSLIEWHIKQMQEVCGEIRICTRPEWLPIIENLNLSVELHGKQPSSMTDALQFLVNNDEANFLVGMPDTYIGSGPENIYRPLLEFDSEVVLGAFNCPVELFGKVGQIETMNGRVLKAVDKQSGCTLNKMWGLLYFQDNSIALLDSTFDSPSKQIQGWIDSKHSVSSVDISGKYIDAGTFQGICTLYESLI